METMRELKNCNNIYVVCPANMKTGGTELLHQLVHQLKMHNKNAFIAYYAEGEYDKNDPTAQAFKQYVDSFVWFSDIPDKEENLVVFPEVCIGKHRRFKHCKKCFWWLSVDNYHSSVGYLNRLKKYGFLSFAKHLVLNDYPTEKDILINKNHLFQSYYAKEFLISKGVQEKDTAYLSDYINDLYLTSFEKSGRCDMVIYNPKKGMEFTEKLINAAHDIQWVPIQNMTNQEVRELMRKAKVYIDFGNHPGKDRIPREAAMSGCCIITNRKGSAAFVEDVPIPERCKFYDDEEEIENILGEIRLCLQEYERKIDDFESYRKFISEEKSRFNEDVKLLFVE